MEALIMKVCGSILGAVIVGGALRMAWKAKDALWRRAAFAAFVLIVGAFYGYAVWGR